VPADDEERAAALARGQKPGKEEEPEGEKGKGEEGREVREQGPRRGVPPKPGEYYKDHKGVWKATAWPTTEGGKNDIPRPYPDKETAIAAAGMTVSEADKTFGIKGKVSVKDKKEPEPEKEPEKEPEPGAEPEPEPGAEPEPEKGEPEPEPEKAPEGEKPKPKKLSPEERADDAQKYMGKVLKKVLGENSRTFQQVGTVLSQLSDGDRDVAVLAFEEALKEEKARFKTSDPEEWAFLAKEGGDLLSKDPTKIEDAEELGKTLAAQAVVRAVVANPSMVGGTMVRGMTNPEDLAQRRQESLKHFKTLAPALRKEAMEQWAEQMKGVPDGPEYKEREAILNGLAMAAYLKTEPVASSEGQLRSPMAPQFVEIAKATLNGGNYELLDLSEDQLVGPEGRAILREGLEKLPDASLQGMLANKPFGKAALLLDAVGEDGNPVIGEEQQGWLREFIQDQVLFDATSAQAFVNSMNKAQAEEGEVPMARKVRDERTTLAIREFQENDPELPELEDELLKCLEAKDKDNCKEKLGAKITQRKSCRLVEYLDEYPDHKMPEGNPEYARHKNICETGETSLTDEVLVPQKK